MNWWFILVLTVFFCNLLFTVDNIGWINSVVVRCMLVIVVLGMIVVDWTSPQWTVKGIDCLLISRSHINGYSSLHGRFIHPSWVRNTHFPDIVDDLHGHHEILLLYFCFSFDIQNDVGYFCSVLLKIKYANFFSWIISFKWISLEFIDKHLSSANFRVCFSEKIFKHFEPRVSSSVLHCW